MTKTILRVDASGRPHESRSRQFADQLLDRLRGSSDHLIHRDLSGGVPYVDASWISANTTPDEDRTDAHHEALAYSESLIEEWEASNVVVIATPIYNFGVPAVLKAYVDQICRARRTFRYSKDGPVGLLADRPTFLVITSGGTRIGSDIDWASGYLRHVLRFIGVTDVRLIAADRLLAETGRGTEISAGINSLDLV